MWNDVKTVENVLLHRVDVPPYGTENCSLYRNRRGAFAIGRDDETHKSAKSDFLNEIFIFYGDSRHVMRFCWVVENGPGNDDDKSIVTKARIKVSLRQQITAENLS